MPVGKRQK